MNQFDDKKLKVDYDYLAPDGSEIRLLSDGKQGGLAHCTLLPKDVSTAVCHKTVEEIWYFISGEGEVWRKLHGKEKVTTVSAGMSLVIPVETHFQFRNTGTEPLCFVIATMPPWPGPDESTDVQGIWKAAK